MKDDPIDEALRAHFAALRARDLAAVPAFDAVLTGTAAPTRGADARPRPGLALAAAGAVLLTVASAWLLPALRPETPELASLALPGWRTPTDTLLPNSGAAGPAPWAGLPTAALGQRSFDHPPETP